jgi:hypothetical protein
MDRDTTQNPEAQVLLTIAGSRFECDAIVALLESCELQVLRGARDGRGGVVDDNCIYVRAADLDLARELLTAPVELPD